LTISSSGLSEGPLILSIVRRRGEDDGRVVLAIFQAPKHVSVRGRNGVLALDPRFLDDPLLIAFSSTDTVSLACAVVTTRKMSEAVVLDRVSFIVEQRDIPFLAGIVIFRSSNDVGLIVRVGQHRKVQKLDIGDDVSAGVKLSHYARTGV